MEISIPMTKCLDRQILEHKMIFSIQLFSVSVLHLSCRLLIYYSTCMNKPLICLDYHSRHVVNKTTLACTVHCLSQKLHFDDHGQLQAKNTYQWIKEANSNNFVLLMMLLVYLRKREKIYLHIQHYINKNSRQADTST